MTRTVYRVRAGFKGGGRFCSKATFNRSLAHGGKKCIKRVEEWKIKRAPPPPPPIEIPPPDEWFNTDREDEELYG